MLVVRCLSYVTNSAERDLLAIAKFFARFSIMFYAPSLFSFIVLSVWNSAPLNLESPTWLLVNILFQYAPCFSRCSSVLPETDSSSSSSFITFDKGGGKCFCQCSFVCLSVCLLARLLKNSCMDLDEMLRVDRRRHMDDLIKF